MTENLKLGAYGRRDPDVRGDIDRWFGIFPRLADRRDQPAGSLSGGEQQMLAVARALLSRPALLLLDEPSLGLAPLVVREVFEVLERIRAEQGTGMLLVEQNAALALELADAAYVLVAGGRLSARLRDPRRGLGPAQLPRSWRSRGAVPVVVTDADGSIYAARAGAGADLPVHRVVNSRRAMAMFATFVAWALADAGVPLGLAAGALTFASLPAVVERVLIRPVEGGNPLSLAIVTLGLFIIVNSAAG